MNIKVVNMVPQDHSDEQNQNSEPSIAVNPADPSHIVASAFTPTDPGHPEGPVYASIDGGDTWYLSYIIPGGQSGDFTPRFGGASSELYVGNLRGDTGALNGCRTANPFASAAMEIIESRASIDQPWAYAATVMGGADSGKDRAYIGSNDSAQPGGKTAVVDVCLDALVATPSFTTVPLEKRSTGTAGLDGYEIRPVSHPDGTVYVAFKGWRASDGTNVTSDVVLCRDDQWGGSPNPFTALIDPGDGLSGYRVVTGITFDIVDNMGQERLGNDLAIAVDPGQSSTVWICWGDQQGSTNTLHVRRGTLGGTAWTADLLVVPNATCVALAVNIEGKCGILYQQLAAGNWETHFQVTADGIGWQDFVLSRAPAAQPAATFQPYLGDYTQLQAVGKDFYGAFCANNTPDPANFPQGVVFHRNNSGTAAAPAPPLLGSDGTTIVQPSIDPFFFKVTELAAASDFYVRDWSDSSGAHDTGLEPSTHPYFFTTSDVWTQRGTTTPNSFNANDQPQNETPWDTNSGDNYAYARISRNAPAAAGVVDVVSATFLFSEFGTGSPYQLALPTGGTNASESVTFNDSQLIQVTPAHQWDLHPTTSQHLCLAVEISFLPDDPGITPSLLGRTPGWPQTDEIVINDNNKAQRNMGVYPATHSGHWSYFAVVHNGAPQQRDLQVRYEVPSGIEHPRQAQVELIDPLGKPVTGSFRSGETITLAGMQPGENRWVGLTMAGPRDNPLTVMFLELQGNTVVNGFGITAQPAPLATVIRANLEMHAAVFGRVTAQLGRDDADEEREAARRLYAEEADDRSYYRHLRTRREALLRCCSELCAAQSIGDHFRIATTVGRLYDALDHSPQLSAAAHSNLLHRLDAYLTMLQKAQGDPAAILENVRWQSDLYTRLPGLQRLSCAAQVRERSHSFAGAVAHRRRRASDFRLLVGELMGCYRDTVAALSSPHLGLSAAVAAMQVALDEPAALQKAHREFLLRLQQL